MPTFTVTHAWRLDGYGVVQTLEALDGLVLGSTITLAGTTVSGLNGSHVVRSLNDGMFTGVSEEGDLEFDPDYILLNQILFVDAGDDHPRGAHSGTVTYTPTCTWIVAGDVTEFLGIAAATANDTAFITTCVNAANAFASRRRREAGYWDTLNVAPSADVKLGTTLYASSLYRERGSVDSFQSYDAMSMPQPTLSMGRVLQLLGCGRPQIG